MIELELYLRRTFEADVPECTHCTELCTLGYACNNDEIDVLADDDEDSGACKVYIHRHCYAALRRAATAANPIKCPACAADWSTAPAEQGRGKSKGKGREKTGVKEMGEWSVPDGYEDPFRRRKRRSNAVSEEDDLDEDALAEKVGLVSVVDAVVEEEELESDSPAPQPAKAKAKRGKLVKKGQSKK